mmetsp:Transcript_9267/g.30939  ORF Transcript_9267/g.30939 Transcript_9267/m.30939 type:complete len:94 (+) Transcript_9267:44-325(+)
MYRCLTERVSASLLRRQLKTAVQQERISNAGSAESMVCSSRSNRAWEFIFICAGGEPSSIEFVSGAGMDYVSCSPFRVPIARLAAAQVFCDSA